MITTIKIREGNALFHETGLFSTLSITGKVKAGTFFTIHIQMVGRISHI